MIAKTALVILKKKWWRRTRVVISTEFSPENKLVEKRLRRMVLEEVEALFKRMGWRMTRTYYDGKWVYISFAEVTLVEEE